MAYVTKYKVAFTNEQMQLVEILFKEKDGTTAPQDIKSYAAASVKRSYNGEEGKYTSIFGSSLDVEFDVQATENDPWSELSNGQTDKWLVEALIEGYTSFTGYVLPDEGGVPFQDKPFNVRITATDGIGLLKDKQPDAAEFNSHHAIIKIWASILKQTGLSLPIRIYDNIYHRSFNNRDVDKKWDFAGQAYLEYRSLLKDATTFENSHQILQNICKDNFRVFQWNGQWVFIRLGMLQYVPFVGYYTIYDANGDNPVGYEITEDYATVGKAQIIYPHGGDQLKYVKKAVRSAKSIYNYEIWPEIPKNNKFEKGEPFGSSNTAIDDVDEDGDGDFTEVIGYYLSYPVADWEHGLATFSDSPVFTLDDSTLTGTPFVKRIYNNFDIELRREVVIYPSASTNNNTHNVWLKSTGIPVVMGDRIKFSVDKRSDTDWHDSGVENYDKAAVIYLVTASGAVYYYNTQGSGGSENQWVSSGLGGGFAGHRGFVTVSYGSEGDTRKFASVSIETQPIPASGTLYIALINSSFQYVQFFRNVEFEYFPYVSGGFRQVKGDYWKFTQTAQDFPDRSEEEVYLSDNPHKIFKGCLLNSVGVPLTADWYRMGLNERMTYLQLTNYNKFQLEQRRYWFIEGSFTGLMYAANNNPLSHYPLGLHKQYLFADTVEGKRFILGAPLDMDLVSGEFTGRFYEVYIDNRIFFDGQRAGTTEHKYIF